jgi:intracellular multiplication protein IcmP
MSKQQQGSGGDNSLDFLWLIVLIVGSIVAIWFFGKEYIASFLYAVRYYEIIFLHKVMDVWGLLVGWAGIPSADLTSLNYWIAVVERNLGPAEFSVMKEISQDVGVYYRFGMAGILGVLAAAVYAGSAATRFNVTQSMKTLLKGEQELWHAVSPVIDLDLVSQDIDEGPWRMVAPPMPYVKKHDLAIETTKDRKPVLEVVSGKARCKFIMQLGKLWVSAHDLPPHLQALFVIFGARAIGKSDDANKLLEQISRSAKKGGALDFSGSKLALMKLRSSELIAKVVYRHAYVSTVMAAMLELGRCDGVLASSEFIWLKPLDRQMWYVLNDMGRQTPSVESAGVFAHLAAERKFGRPLRVPMIEEAVVGLGEALSEILYEPEES